MILVTAPLVTSCIPVVNRPEFPSEWRLDASKRIGTCPDITGIYANQGRLYIEAGIRCTSSRVKDGQWSCDLGLAQNLGIASPAVSVEITQPDSTTMNVGLRDESGARLTQTLKLAKDYQCDVDGLYFSSSGSVVEARALSGASLQHRRAFVRDMEGGLVMTVREVTAALVVFIGIYKSDTSYVRWMPVKMSGPAPNDLP